MENTFYQKASFWQRLGAFLIDNVIVFGAITLLSQIIQLSQDQHIILTYVALALYGALFVWKVGATPGKMLFKIKVVSTAYKPVSFGRALLRESIGRYVAELVLFLGYLWVLIDKKSQGWDDKIANTFVVKLDPAKKLIHATSDEPVSRKRKITFWILILFNPLTLATLFLIIYIFLFRPFQISGDAMYPNYKNRQYYLSTIQRDGFSKGDVIVFKAPHAPKNDFIKRVIGLPGDKVMLKDGSVYVNGELLDESGYLTKDVITYGGQFLHDSRSVTVPDQNYFVLGDNRPFSSDSREWGFVPRENIVGRITMCYWNCSSAK